MNHESHRFHLRQRTTWPHLSLRNIPSGSCFTKGCGAIPVFQTHRPKGRTLPSDSVACGARRPCKEVSNI